MINNISEYIAKRWVSKSIISAEDYKLYHYGWFVVISDLWLFLFTLILGALFNVTLSSIVFFVIFFIIRRFAGGFHAKTELHCQIISLSFLFLSIVVIKYSLVYIDDMYILIANLMCAIVLPLVSPADTPQKPLTQNEQKLFKKITGCIGVLLLILNCIMTMYRIRFITIPVVSAFVLETVLVILGKKYNSRLKAN